MLGVDLMHHNAGPTLRRQERFIGDRLGNEVILSQFRASLAEATNDPRDDIKGAIFPTHVSGKRGNRVSSLLAIFCPMGSRAIACLFSQVSHIKQIPHSRTTPALALPEQAAESPSISLSARSQFGHILFKTD
jgi:hypothetical protein